MSAVAAFFGRGALWAALLSATLFAEGGGEKRHFSASQWRAVKIVKEEDIALLEEFGISPEVYKAWYGAHLLDIHDPGVYTRIGEISTLVSIGMRPMEFLRWKEAGWHPRELVYYYDRLRIRDPKVALRWKRSGLSRREMEIAIFDNKITDPAKAKAVMGLRYNRRFSGGQFINKETEK